MPPPKDRFTLIGLPAEKRRVRFAHDVRAGLTASPKSLPCCYFYDRLGSRLFEAICELPEYYLTRAETAILQAHAREIAALFPGPTDLIELGSGSAVKTRMLIEAFLTQTQKSEARHPKSEQKTTKRPVALFGASAFGIWDFGFRISTNWPRMLLRP